MAKFSTDSTKEFGFFVGDELAFSDGILKHTRTEFSSLQFVRIATLEEALDIPAAQAGQCRIIVVDEAQVDDLRERLPDVLAHFAKTRMALSYRRTAIAEMFLRHAADDPVLAKVGLLPMRLEIDHWMAVLRMIICGERYVPYELFHAMPTAQIVPQAPARAPQPAADGQVTAKPKGLLAKLTDREKQVLTSVSEGKQNKIIAAELDLSEHTVKLHIHNVISKLGVNNRTEAAICFLADKPKPNGRSPQ